MTRELLRPGTTLNNFPRSTTRDEGASLFPMILQNFDRMHRKVNSVSYYETALSLKPTLIIATLDSKRNDVVLALLSSPQ
jgi:hypothetical protein